MRKLVSIVGTQWLVTGLALAGSLAIENAVVETRSLEGGLESTVRAWSKAVDEAAWLGWSAPMRNGEEVLCCWHSRDRRWQTESCDLESSRRQFVFSSDRPRALVRGNRMIIVVRAEGGEVTDLRAYSEGCLLDAGGRDLLWLEDVQADDSVIYLTRLAESRTRFGDEALMATALHDSPRVAKELARISKPGHDSDLRGEALFWLSHSGVPEASEIILEALSVDPDSDVREEAIFALSMLPDQQGIPHLLTIIRDRSRPSKVREQAFFWYVQSGDDQALDLIAEILTN